MGLGVQRRGLRAAFAFFLFGLIALSTPIGTNAQDPPPPPQRWDGLIERLSTPGRWNSETFTNPRVSRHAVSADGRYFVFAAEVSTAPYPPSLEFFINDRMTGVTNMLGPGPIKAAPVISSDGNHHAVENCSFEYRPEGPVCDIIAIDQRSYAMTNMSTALDGTLSTGDSSEPMLSRDGRFIVFRTDSPTLLPPGAPPGQIVLRDRDTDQDGVYDEPDATSIRVVSVARSGDAGNMESASPVVSADGRFVAFRSKANNLVFDDTNDAWDVFLHDAALRRTVRVNVGWDGQEATPQIDSPAISMSEDGQYIAFAADDSYIVNPPTPYPDLNDALDVFLYDRHGGYVTRIDIGQEGQIGQGGHTHWPSLSADGRYVSVVSTITNAANPGTPGRAHVYVYDRVTREATRVSTKPDGSEPDRDSAYSTISGDGSLVTFVSRATNLPTGAPADTDTVYAAVHFDVTLASATLPARGGQFAMTVTAQQYVRWEAFLTDWWWLRYVDFGWGVGNGTVTFEASRNWEPVARATDVVVESKTITVTQEPGLDITGFSPMQGPASGGTVVTITGTGFEPGMQVFFSGYPGGEATSVEFVSTTTIRATTPAAGAGSAWINVVTGDWSAGDGTSEPFRFLDVTPPIVEGFAYGQQTDGWFTGDVTIGFSYWDPESSVVSWDGCDPFMLRTDTAGTTYTCTATSEGGTSTASVFVKRDATGPEIDLIAPAQTLYRQDADVLANFTCTDTLNQTTECVGQQPVGAAIDMSPGYHAFSVTAMDSLGHLSWRDVMYAVASGVCAPRPEGLVAWFPFEIIDEPAPQPSFRDAFSGSEGEPMNMQFVPGAAGSFAAAPSGSPSYVANPSNDLYRMTGPMTLSAWVKPGSGTGTTEVIAGREGEYMLSIAPDARMQWAMATSGRGWVWNSSYFQLQRGEWAHVALTFDGSHVRLYVNGMNYEAWWGSGPVGDARPELNEFRIGASEDPAAPGYFSGAIDEVMLVNRALNSSEIQTMFLAGSDSLCGKRAATVTVAPDPVTVPYGKTVNQIFTVSLATEGGSPIAGRRILFFDQYGQILVTADTDASGQARIGGPVTGSAIGTQPGFEARFLGDFYYTGSSGSNVLNVERAVPTITWPTPFSIVYGTPLSATQLNATASVAGTFTYTPPAGTVLEAGMHMLRADFVPADSTLYQNAMANVWARIDKATPTVMVAGGTFRHDGLPHSATGTVTGVGGVTLGPLTFTYNGSPEPPVNLGTYTVVATYAGDANHTSATATTTLKIGDGTPPAIVPWVEGTVGANGWYISNVRVGFTYSDPESSITTTTGCTTLTLVTDTAGTTYTCSATSDGGTGSASVTIRRDTQPPVATITSPLPTVYASGAVVVPAFTCSDAASGATTCVGSTTDPVDTITPGYHTFSVTASDQAGNTGTTTIEYAVGSGACSYPLPDLRGWWRFEGDRANWMVSGNNASRIGFTSDVFVPGVVGQAYQFEGPNGYLATNFDPIWWNDEKFAIAAWVKPSANPTVGTILRNREGYAVARLANGSIAWAFRKFNVPGLTYYDTGVKLPLNVWSHVVVDLDKTTVRTYLNGRLAHTATSIGDLYNMNSRYGITLGGADDRAEYFRGALDEVKVFDHGLDGQRVEQLYFAGAQGACVHKRTSLEFTQPFQAYYGNTTYAMDIRLVDENGQPVAGRTLNLLSQVSSWPYASDYEDLVTDSDGRVHWDVPLRNAARGMYDDFVWITFAGDVDYARVFSRADVFVNKGTPAITWPAPAPITYGTNLSNTQLNATASIAGTFAYSPAAGTLLSAGSHTLSTTFTPTDSYNYNPATVTVPLTVNKSTPTVTVTGGTFVYDGAPHAATGTVKNQWSQIIGTPTFTYNGSTEPPVAAGTYEVVASYAGSANYAATSVTAMLTITKATPSLTWATPASIVYGTPVGPAQLSASSNVPGTFAYTPDAGTVLPAGVQSLFVTFTPTDAVNYQPATASVTLTVNKAVPAVTWSNPADITYGTALGDAQLSATANVPGTFAYSHPTGTVLNAGVHSLSVTFTPDDAANYLGAGTAILLRVNPAMPVVTWPAPADVVYGTALDAAQLNATANVPGTFTYTPAAGTVLSAGTHALSASFEPADGTNYQRASASVTIRVAKATPAVTVSGGTFTYDANAHPATGSVTGADGVTLGPLTFTYNGSADAPVNAGTYEVVASYAGDANHEPASATATITISKAPAVVTWPAATDIVYGVALGAAQLNAAANVAGTFTYSPVPGTQLAAGTHTLAVEFAPADVVNYQPGSASVTITVIKATPVVTASGGTFTYDANAHPATGSVTGADAVTLGPLTFTYNGSADAPVNAGTYEVVASYAGDANHEPASATTTVTIGKGTTSLTWSTPATIVYGTALGAAQLNAAANVPGTFTYTPAAATVLDAGEAQTLRVTFTPADAANYNTASASTSINVTRAPLTVRASDAVKRFGAPLPVFSATTTGLVNGDTTAVLTGTLTLATTATQQSAVGAYAIVPAGVSAANYTVTFANGSLSIVRGGVDVALTTSPEPSGAAQPMTFTAAVTAQAPAAGTPGGIVRFFDGTTLIGSAPVLSNSATLSTAGLEPGMRTIEARYEGDGSFEPGAGSSSHVITDANNTPALTVTSSRNPSNAGQSVTLTANVSMAAGAVSGMVEFYSAGTLLSTTPISAGRAVFTTSSLAAGSHAITARYVGSGGVPPSRSDVFVQTVGATGWKNRATSMMVTSTPNPAALGDAVVITADVIGTSSTSPTGRILIMVDGIVVTEVAASTINATTARATVSLPNLAHGRHTVSAAYLGDATYKGSTASTTVVVN